MFCREISFCFPFLSSFPFASTTSKSIYRLLNVKSQVSEENLESSHDDEDCAFQRRPAPLYEDDSRDHRLATVLSGLSTS